MKPTSFTRTAIVRYTISAIAFCGALSLLILGYEAVGCVTGGLAFGLAYSTADSNGHLTHFHFAKKKQK